MVRSSLTLGTEHGAVCPETYCWPFQQSEQAHMSLWTMAVWSRFGAGKRPERVTGEAITGPGIQRRCTQTPIEVDRRLIPIQYGPFQPAVASLDDQPRKITQ